jgi:hypothetical protein
MVSVRSVAEENSPRPIRADSALFCPFYLSEREPLSRRQCSAQKENPGEISEMLLPMTMSSYQPIRFSRLSRITMSSFATLAIPADDGILDRLVHNAHRIEMRGDSMRKKRGSQPSS